MKNILILGGSGFIGKNIIESYKNDPEVNLIVVTRKAITVDKHLFESQNVVIKIGSIGDSYFIENLVIDYCVDIIIHLVSGLIPSSSEKEFYTSFDDVIIPTLKLIDFISNMNIKFIFFSSGGTIYGDSEDLINESHRLSPVNNYGYSKLVIENYLQFKSKVTRLDFIILRPSNVYGKYQNFDGKQGFISVAIKKIYKKIPIEIWGDGQSTRDYIYIDDVVAILKKILELNVSRVVFNLSSGIGFTLLEIIKIIERKLNRESIVNFTVKRIVDINTLILDNSNLLECINHDMTSIERGIDNQIINFNIAESE